MTNEMYHKALGAFIEGYKIFDDDYNPQIAEAIFMVMLCNLLYRGLKITEIKS